MASEVAQAPSTSNQQPENALSPAPESTSHPESQVNGLGASDEAAGNASGFSGNAALPATDLDMSSKIQPVSSVPDINPAGPTPVDDVAPGIQPVADFVPKDASTLSHPTPPPDEPLNTGAADVDTEMANTESDAPPQLPSEAATPAQGEQSLVRPRDDDGEDEPAAKRTRVDESAPVQEEVAPITTDGTVPASESTGDVAQPPVAGEEKSDAAPSHAAETAEDAPGESMEDVVPESANESAQSAPAAPAESAPTDVQVENTQEETQPSEVTSEAAVKTEPASTVPETQVDVKPAVPEGEAQPTSLAAAAASSEAVPGTSRASTAPMTAYQKSSLLEKMKNLKKTKHSSAFLRPVDFVALNIPSYPEIIKNPMDLGTMENKLKSDEYASVQDLVNDFDLIIANVHQFNGPNHTITHAGNNMKAYFDRMIAQVPSPDAQQPAPKSQKKRSPSVAQEPKRRESRAAAAPAAAQAAPQAPSPLQQEAFALQSDGTPQIRRASSNVRPARAIKPPQNREIAYSKPRRKEHLLELRFAEHVLDEIRGAKLSSLNHVFQLPVDPVALNIPNYRQVIKHPMDLSTMVQKMKSGQYGTANEFKKDFDLMIKNCLLFNPVGNPVRDLAIGLQREFENLWADKNKWEKRNAPASTRASSASAEGDSDDEEEEEETGGGGGGADDTVAALKKQIAAMQSTLESLSGGGGGGSAGKSSNKAPKAQKKGGNKKAGGASSAPAPKPAAKPTKPKRERMITYEEKDEISKAVERMDEKQISKLTEIITRECPKYRDMEEMELEIDDLPNGVQLMLLRYVREIFGNPNRKKSAAAARDFSPDDVAAQDDDDFEPRSRGGAGGGGGAGKKRKKHAPMTKTQQEEQLRALQGKLQEFSNAATSGSESPTASSFNQQNAQAESSEDEESEESEEE